MYLFWFSCTLIKNANCVESLYEALSKKRPNPKLLLDSTVKGFKVLLIFQISVCNIDPSPIYIFRQEMLGTFIFSLNVYQNLEVQNGPKTLATCKLIFCVYWLFYSEVRYDLQISDRDDHSSVKTEIGR